MLAPEKLKELRELAEKATPGTVRESQNDKGEWLLNLVTDINLPGSGISTLARIRDIDGNGENDAKYYAAVNPKTVSELLDELERLRKEISNFLTYGQGGAGFKESQLLSKLHKAEAERDELRAQAVTPSNSCLICGYDKPFKAWVANKEGKPVAGICEECLNHARDYPQLEAQAAAMRKALEIFADARRWRYKHCWVYYGESPYLLAQQALSTDAGPEDNRYKGL